MNSSKKVNSNSSCWEYLTSDMNVPICPYCGKPDSAIGLSSDTEIVCKNCEKEYLVKRLVKITFSTFKKESGNA